MPDAAGAVLNRPEAQSAARSDALPDSAQNRISELRVSGHLMTLDTGLFCVLQAPGSVGADAETGLPGVRVSLPPGLAGRADAVSISTFRNDGWLDGTAALVRVSQGPAQVLVTVYQSPRQGPESAPRLQVLRLNGEPAAVAAPGEAPAQAQAAEPEVVAHVQRTGDVGGKLGDWIGTRGSKMWIEGFAVSPQNAIAADDIEYQAVLGRGWLSPWVEGGKFCGSRGMALPLLGLKVRLKGAAARNWDVSYEATFTDGSVAGPAGADEACEAESLAALESFRIELHRRGGRTAGERMTERAPLPAAKPTRPTRPGRIIRPAGKG
ncbi:MAG TPA: hypothetical protein VGG99_29575 [Acetobacteraceae bacterium]|jgi:hypothetical protein